MVCGAPPQTSIFLYGNAGKWRRIIKAFRSLKLQVQDIEPADFTGEQVFSFGMEPDAVDILTFSRGVSLDEVFKNAVKTKIDDLDLKIIDIRSLLKNKEGIQRLEEKGLVDQQDILALKRIIKAGKKY